MKRKYFLRGLGAGIILSAVVMGVTSSKADLTDSEIRKRALELGMVEKPDVLEGVLKETKIPATTSAAIVTSDKNDLETPEPTDFPVITPTTKNKTTSVPSYVKPKTTQKAASNPVPKATQSSAVTAKTTPKPAVQNTAPKIEIISVDISAGMWSDEIAQKFEELKLVDNAKAFDKFLCDNDYASQIRVGSYRIPKGSSYEEIAKIITTEDE